MGVQVRPLFPVFIKPQKIKTMEELKEKLAGLGIAEEQIDSVIETVFGFIKDKLPDGMEGIADSLMNGETPDMGDLGGGLMDKAKGLFGG